MEQINGDKIKKEFKDVETRIRKRTVTFIAAGLSLVAGLAWNDAIQSLINYLFPLSQNSVLAKILYAVVLSVLIIVAITYLEKLFRVDE